MQDQERDWALQLKKAQQQTTGTSRIPVALQQKQVDEELTFYKAKLKIAISTHAEEKIHDMLQKLIELRAKQTALRLLNMKQQTGQINPTVLYYEIRKYSRECTALVQATAPTT